MCPLPTQEVMSVDEESTSCYCLLEAQRCQVLLQHPGRYALVGEPLNQDVSKRLRLAVFGSPDTSSSLGFTLRVYCVDDTPHAFQVRGKREGTEGNGTVVKLVVGWICDRHLLWMQRLLHLRALSTGLSLEGPSITALFSIGHVTHWLQIILDVFSTLDKQETPLCIGSWCFLYFIGILTCPTDSQSYQICLLPWTNRKYLFLFDFNACYISYEYEYEIKVFFQ